jgi:hypothetical protein
LREEIAEIGEKTIIDLAFMACTPSLLRWWGCMRFRSSRAEPPQHTVANLCATMAAEMGL